MGFTIMKPKGNPIHPDRGVINCFVASADMVLKVIKTES